MAREEFLFNLHNASGFLSPTLYVDGIRLEVGHLAGILGIVTNWLTERAVEGFEEADFPEIPEAERRELARNVEKFRAIVREVPGDGPATAARVRDAIPVFLAILSAMWPYLEGFRVYAALKRQRFPDFVRDFAVKVGEDSTGDPATWIWVIVDDRVSVKQMMPDVPEIRRLVNAALDRAGIALYPYILFRTESEQLELEGVPAR